MNHFLAGLIDRAEGRMPVLERRARALFEPPEPGGSRPLESLEYDDIPTRSRHAAQSHRSDDVGTPRPPMRVDTPPSDVRQRDAIAVRHSDDAERAPRRNSDATPRGGSLTAEHVPSVRPRAALAGDVDRIAPHATPREPVVDRPESRAPIVERTPAPERAPIAARTPMSEQRPAPRERRVLDAPPAMVRSTSVERTRASLPATPKSNEAVTPRSAVLLARAQTSATIRRERPAAVLPPPVQITIGRVEVRAVAAPSGRAPSSAPAAPRLSLDEYLRQRDGAAR